MTPGSLVSGRLTTRATNRYGSSRPKAEATGCACGEPPNGTESAILPMKVPSPSTIGFRRAYVMMLAAQFFFATVAVCGREAGQQSDWRIATLARSWLVLALAVAVARVAGAQLTVRGTPTLWVRSLTGSVSMLLTFFALTRAESIAIVITFTNTFPLWVTLLAWPV